MNGHVFPFPLPRRSHAGTVCVTGDSVAGFEVGHESASGNSWGSFSGPYVTGQEAITAAYTLNRDVYFGGCDVVVCDAAVQDGCPDVGQPSLPGDF